MTHADKMREVRNTLLALARIWDETPHGDQLNHLASVVPDPEEEERLALAVLVEHALLVKQRDELKEDLRELHDTSGSIERERDELAAALLEIADMNSATAWQAVAIAKTALGEEGT